jgi:hypothetical protein
MRRPVSLAMLRAAWAKDRAWAPRRQHNAASTGSPLCRRSASAAEAAPHRTAPHRTVQVEKQRARKRMNDVLQAAAKAGGAAAAAAGKRLHLRYLLAPEELLADGGGRLRAVRLRRMRLTERRRGEVQV